MLEIVDITEISAIVAAAGVLIGVAYHILNIRHNRRIREMEMRRIVMSDIISEQAIRRYANMQNMEWKDTNDFIEKYGFSKPERFSIWMSWLFAYEMMGIVLKNKVLKAEEMHDLGGYTAILTWEKFKDIIQDFRDAGYGQTIFSNAEFYAQEMLKVKLRKDATIKDKLKTLPPKPH